MPIFQKFVVEKWWPVYPSSVNNRPSTVQEKEIPLRLQLMPTLHDLPLDQIRAEVVNQLIILFALHTGTGGRAARSGMGRRGLSQRVGGLPAQRLTGLRRADQEWQAAAGASQRS